MSASPTAAKMEFSIRVREQRKRIGLGAQKVSDLLDFSRVYYSAVENGRTLLSEAKLPTLVQHLKFDKREAGELERLLRDAREPGWWNRHSKLIGEDFSDFLGMEAAASTVCVYEGKLITGLLQTTEYATAVVAAAPDISLVEVKEYVDIRLRRQRRLDPPDSLNVTAVLSEAALMQVYGDLGILRAQLEHLARQVETLPASLEVRIQPFDATPVGLSSGSTVVLLEYDNPHLPTLAWRDAGEALGLTSDDRLVETLTLRFYEALASSLSRHDSLELIQKRLSELSRTTSQ